MSDASHEASPLRLFEGFGVELEYMIVRAEDLAILPVTDLVLKEMAGEVVNEVEVESVSWSNEFVLHVLELKNTDPSPELLPLASVFSNHVQRMNALLEPMGAMLLPSGMHPWMRPHEETVLWPHEGREIYETFDRIFNCRRHGWANLQSAQLNLSFGNDDEFGRLHAAIRLLLPVTAALAASSPIAEGEITGLLDTRLEAYRTNSERTPTVTGRVIPEPVFSRKDYEELILKPMYRDVEALDPEGILRHPWLNARGAIAQFVRDAIEIRLLDMQECPAADIAIQAAVTAVLKALTSERFIDYAHQRQWEVEPLARIFLATLRDAEGAVLRDREYLGIFQFPDKSATAQELWLYLMETLEKTSEGLDSRELRVILEQGPLARRMLKALGAKPRRGDIDGVYRALARCLQANEPFLEF